MNSHEKMSFIYLNQNYHCRTGMSCVVGNTKRSQQVSGGERTQVQGHPATWSSLLAALTQFKLKSSEIQIKLPPFHIFVFLLQPTPQTPHPVFPAQRSLCLHIIAIIHCRKHLAINCVCPSVMSSVFLIVVKIVL